MSEPRHVVEVAGIRWSVGVWGEGPPVLAVHGAGSTSHSFEPLAEHMEGYTVVAPDLPGHGRTPLDAGSGPALPVFAAGLGEVLEHLGHAPQIAIGHSAGAAVVGTMCLEGMVTPDLCVGLGAAFVPFEPGRQTLASLGARFLARSGIGRRLSRLTPLMEALVPDGDLPAERAAAYRRLATDPDHVEGVLGMLGRWDVAPLYDALHVVPSRWLLLSGTDDQVVPAHHQRLVASRMRDARCALLPGGHLFHEVDPAAVAREIAREMDSLHSIV